MAINPTIASADNGPKSMADILGDDAHLLDGQPSIDTHGAMEHEDVPEDPVQFPTEGEPQRDDQGRFTKAEDDVPGILKDEENKDEDDLPDDDELDDLLKGLPDNEVERARKGVQKVVNRAKAKEQQAERILSWDAALSNPETAADALAQLTEHVHKNILKVEPQTQQSPHVEHTVQTPSDEDAQLANETWAETKARWGKEFIAQAKAEMRQELGTELAPIKGFVNEQVTDRQLSAKVAESMPSLEGEYGSFATTERVRQAIEKYPTMPPVEAFIAVHRKAWSQHLAKPLPQLKREMVSQGALATAEINRQPGDYVSFDQIFAEQGIME